MKAYESVEVGKTGGKAAKNPCESGSIYLSTLPNNGLLNLESFGFN